MMYFYFLQIIPQFLCPAKYVGLKHLHINR